jgi:hypothetical protein
MKKLNMLLLSAVAAFAVDYSTMSMEELQAARGTIADTDKAAFQAEMQSRMQALTPEERAAATASMRQSKSGAQDGSGTQMRSGGGQKSSSGMGSGTGSKMQYRGSHR